MFDGAITNDGLGVDRAWSAEAWGMDAISPLAFIAARTTRLEVGTGIMQVCARTPASTAMTALSMQTVTDGRFYFTDFVVPTGTTVEFAGANAAQLFVRGENRLGFRVQFLEHVDHGADRDLLRLDALKVERIDHGVLTLGANLLERPELQRAGVVQQHIRTPMKLEHPGRQGRRRAPLAQLQRPEGLGQDSLRQSP